MQAINATIGDIPIERRRISGRAARHAILGAAAAASVGAIAAYALHARHAATPAAATKPAARAAAPAPAQDIAKLYGAVVVEPDWLAASDSSTLRAPVAAPPVTLASLGLEGADQLRAPAAAPPPPASPEPPPNASASLLPDTVPLPPVRSVPRIDDTAPLPPERPPQWAEQAPAPAQPPSVAQPGAAPSDERNVLQKLLGIGTQPGQPGQPAAAAASAPAAPAPTPAVPAKAAAPEQQPAAPPETTVARATPGEGRTGGGLFGLFGGYTPASPNLDRLGYDRQTAVYDISARALYLPDGTRLEAHSGLGGALDDVRYVNERAVGPTPPHLYELTMREALFHGVQALRLNPVGGDGSVFGRAGLLAHPYMLGPNGDSNGCVSVKNYEAFLHAYESGQINKLAVVERL